MRKQGGKEDQNIQIRFDIRTRNEELEFFNKPYKISNEHQNTLRQISRGFKEYLDP